MYNRKRSPLYCNLPHFCLICKGSVLAESAVYDHNKKAFENELFSRVRERIHGRETV